ncbi:flagellar hook-length control protein FliK [bacterium]|nr:flagellar hook-length control protein FliK [bacterium]MBU1152790.1 flagellar hook-length control protein FliK [bacterium]
MDNLSKVMDLLSEKKDNLVSKKEDFLRKSSPEEEITSLNKPERTFKETLTQVQETKKEIKKGDNKEDQASLEKELEGLLKKLTKDKNINSQEAEKLILNILQILKEGKISLGDSLKKIDLKESEWLNALKDYQSVLKPKQAVSESGKLVEESKERNLKTLDKDIKKVENVKDGNIKDGNVKDGLGRDGLEIKKVERQEILTQVQETKKEIKKERPKILASQKEENNQTSSEKLKVEDLLNLDKKAEGNLGRLKTIETNTDHRYNKKMASSKEESLPEAAKTNVAGELRLKEGVKIFNQDPKDLLTTKLQRQEMIMNVIQEIKTYLRKGHQEMRLFLKPESLGEVSLKVVIKKNNLLANFTVTNEAVKEIMESSLNQLKDSFNSLGTNFEEIKIMVDVDKKGSLFKEGQKEIEGSKKDLNKRKEERSEEIEGINEVKYWQPFWLAKVIDYVV